MNLGILGCIADILGILSFILSLNIFRKINQKTESQKETYKAEREQLFVSLLALQQNIWDDGLINAKIQDALQTKIFEYQIKYLFISSPRCIFHAFRCSHLLKSGITKSNEIKIRTDINYLIARLSKKE